jgi:hypothetical protein
MEPLLGFIVLTGPLFLIILWVPVSIWLAVKVSRKAIKGKNLPLKIAGGLMIFLLTFILPFGDEIAGRIYFGHLCATEAGAKVYQTIELPAEYWDEHGKPRFYDEKTGNMTIEFSQYAEIISNHIIRAFGIEERQSILLDKTTHQKISDNPWFLYWGGWINKTFSPHNTALHCGGDSTDLVGKLFKPKMIEGTK